MPRLGSDRGPAQAAAAIAAALVLLLAVVLVGAGAGLTGGQAACGAQAPASQAAAMIPASYLTLYRQAGRQTGIPWAVLAGIGEVESDHGRSAAAGVRSGTSAAGAAGPMQIGVGGAAGNTWGGAPVHSTAEKTGGYGIDGNHDGQASVYDPADAIPSAALYLKAHGAPGDIPAAVFAYCADLCVMPIWGGKTWLGAAGVGVTLGLAGCW